MIYRRLLEGDFEKLPPALQSFHSAMGERHATGSATVRHHSAWLARLVGFPPEGERVPIRLDVEASDDVEIWTRWFGSNMRRSTQIVVGNLLVETAGPVRVDFHISACERGIQFASRSTRLWGMPVPLRIEASIQGSDSGWELTVDVAHVGSYHGEMRLAG